MIDPIVFILGIVICLIVGFFVGCLFCAVDEPLPGPGMDISDNALARIVHEAYRAYCNSIGKIGVRGWASLEATTKADLTLAIGYVRRGGRIAARDANDIRVHLVHAIVGLVKG